MGSVNLVVIVESVRSIVAKEGDGLQKFHLPSIIAVSVALGMSELLKLDLLLNDAGAGVKFLLFLYSYSLRNRSSQVRVLWEDHRNDLWINGFGAHHAND